MSTPSDAVAHLTPDRWARGQPPAGPQGASPSSPTSGCSRPSPHGDGRYVVRSDDGATDVPLRRRASWPWTTGRSTPTASPATADGARAPAGRPGLLHRAARHPRASATRSCRSTWRRSAPPSPARPTSSPSRRSPPPSSPTPASRPSRPAMTEGHPCFVANNGRLGFGIHEYLSYAPETASPVRLVWLAAHRDHSTFTRRRRTSTTTRSCATSWARRPATRFAGDPDRPGPRPRRLPPAPGAPLAVVEQAVRHLRRRGRPAAPGLPRRRATTSTWPSSRSVPSSTPASPSQALREDRALGPQHGLHARPVGGVHGGHPGHQRLAGRADRRRRRPAGRPASRSSASGPPSATTTGSTRPPPTGTPRTARCSPPCGARARCPPWNRAERLATMASLLHVDRDGGSFAARADRASPGLTPAVWLRRYLDAYLTPLLHSFYAYDLVFMPHGENVILVLEGRRRRAGDLQGHRRGDRGHGPGGGAARRPSSGIRADVPEDMKLLSVFTDVFDCFLRFLSAILVDRRAPRRGRPSGGRSPTASAATRTSVPHLADKFTQYDMFADEFALSCLNRLQLRNNQQMVDLAGPGGRAPAGRHAAEPDRGVPPGGLSARERLWAPPRNAAVPSVLPPVAVPGVLYDPPVAKYGRQTSPS